MASESQHRHLKDLLKEDQEPFLLNNPPLFSYPNLQLNKKPNQNASFPSRFCQNACFFSNADSPLFSSGPKSPSRALFLHVPAKTAALLLEAAIRIHNPNPNPNPETRIKNSGFSLLGSVIRRFTNRSQTRKLRTQKTGDVDVIRWADSVEKHDLGDDEMGFKKGRLSSVWSEENKSSASSSPSSSSSRIGSGDLSEEEGEEEVGFINVVQKQNGSNRDQDFTFSLSPISPFRSPAFSSPARSPPRRQFQDHVNYEQDSSIKSQLQDEDEEKEQNSPVSILDSPFGDDDCEEEGRCRDEEKGLETECSYAFVQRSKQHLLQKLRKFEKLAGLDPIMLDMRTEDDQDEYKELEHCESDNDNDDHSTYPDIQCNVEGYIGDITRNSGVAQDLVKRGMKRLLSDLISEEERSAKCDSSGGDYESVVNRVCKRLECWKEVEPNTIDMMIDMDLKGESGEWKESREDIAWTAKMLEVSIFAVLADELFEDLVS